MPQPNSLSSTLPTSFVTDSQWVTAKLAELLVALESGSRPRGGVNGILSGISSIGGEHLSSDGGFNFTNIRYVPTDFADRMNRGQIAVGDILVVKDGATTGKVSFVRPGFPTPAVVNEHVFIARPSTNLLNAYVFYYLYSQTGKDAIMLDFRGAAQGGISQGFADKVIVPLAPLPEQHRIVAEIERQFSLLDAGIANLKRVQANLKRYRASMLQAACEGRLVPTEAALAQAEGREYEPAAVLLSRILAERRAWWEAEQLAKMEAQGKLALNGAWKAKYQEPVAPDTSVLPKLPEGWTWASIEAISTKVVDGVHKKPDYTLSGIPFVTVKNLTAGSGISFASLHYITLEDHLSFSKRANPERGDLLVSKDGTLGVIRLVKTETIFSIFVSVAMIKPVDRNAGAYLEIALMSPQVQSQMVPKGSGLQHIHLEDLRRDCIPLPPLAEQERIVAEVERCLSVVDNLEQVVKANLKRAERLRQAILKKAFAGRLVPQDPNDEPASILLERIKAEREARRREAQAAPKRRGKANAEQGNHDAAGNAVSSGNARRKRGAKNEVPLHPDLFSANGA